MEVTARGEHWQNNNPQQYTCTVIITQAEREQRLEHAKQDKQELEQQKIEEEAIRQRKIATERQENKLKLIEWRKEQKLHKQYLSQQTLMQQAADMAKHKEKEDARRVGYLI